MTRRKNTRPPSAEPRTWTAPPHENALALAIDHNDWERAALLLLLGVSQAVRSLPRATIDDVLDLIEAEEHRDDHR